MPRTFLKQCMPFASDKVGQRQFELHHCPLSQAKMMTCATLQPFESQVPQRETSPSVWSRVKRRFISHML